MLEMKCRGMCGEWKTADEFGRGRNVCTECTIKVRNQIKRDIRAQSRDPNKPARCINRSVEAKREESARELCATVQTYWHICEPSPRFGVAIINQERVR